MSSALEAKPRIKLRPEEAALLHYVTNSIKIRWSAAIGLAIIGVVMANAFGVRHDLFAVYLVSLGIVAYNSVFWFAGRRFLVQTSSTYLTRIQQFVKVQIQIDLLALTSLFYLTGGVQNPFIIYYVFPVIVASILLSHNSARFHAGQVIALLALLYTLEIEDRLPRAPYWRDFHDAGLLVALCTTIVFTVYLTISVFGELRKQQQWADSSGNLLEKTAELERANENLMRVDKRRSHFLAVASHDLQTPLVAIDSYLQTLLGGLVGPLTDQQRTILARCSLRIESQLGLVKDILDFTTIKSGQLGKGILEIEVSSVVENALETVRAISAQKAITMTSKVPTDLGPMWGYPVRLEGVLNNLLNNAVKYTSPGGHILLAVHEEMRDSGAVVLFEVIDDGVGVREVDLFRVFDEYYRGQDTESQGTGLGLTIAKELVEAQGGRIWVESPYPVQSGRGSRFAFVLPRNGCLREASHQKTA